MRPPTRSRTVVTAALVALVAALAVVAVGCGRPAGSAPAPALGPLRVVGELPLPGDGSRSDYASLDPGRGLLFIAHLGASEMVEVDVRVHRVVRTISNLSQVHGVLVVPALRRADATATGEDRMVPWTRTAARC